MECLDALSVLRYGVSIYMAPLWSVHIWSVHIYMALASQSVCVCRHAAVALGAGVEVARERVAETHKIQLENLNCSRNLKNLNFLKLMGNLVYLEKNENLKKMERPEELSLDFRFAVRPMLTRPAGPEARQPSPRHQKYSYLACLQTCLAC